MENRTKGPSGRWSAFGRLCGPSGPLADLYSGPLADLQPGDSVEAAGTSRLEMVFPA